MSFSFDAIYSLWWPCSQYRYAKIPRVMIVIVLRDNIMLTHDVIARRIIQNFRRWWLCLIMAHFTKSAKKLRKPINQNQKIVTALTMDKLMNIIIIMTPHLVLKESKSEIWQSCVLQKIVLTTVLLTEWRFGWFLLQRNILQHQQVLESYVELSEYPSGSVISDVCIIILRVKRTELTYQGRPNAVLIQMNTVNYLLHSNCFLIDRRKVTFSKFLIADLPAS